MQAGILAWTRTPAVDYADNELVVLQSGQVQDVASVTKGAAVNEYRRGRHM